MVSDYDRQQSEFNDAIGYLRHITQLFMLCSEFSMNFNGMMWFSTLNALYRVLSSEMKEEEQKEIEKMQKELKQSLNIYAKRRLVANNEISESNYNKLQDYEKRLRRIFKESGLQNRMLDDAMKALK